MIRLWCSTFVIRSTWEIVIGAGLFAIVQLFVILIELPSPGNGVALALPLPLPLPQQQATTTTTPSPCNNDFLCEMTRLNNELLNIQRGDLGHVRDIMRRIDELRQRQQEETRRSEEARRKAEQEERRRTEERNQREWQRQQEASKSRGESRLGIGIAVGIVVLLVFCGVIARRACNKGTRGEVHQLNVGSGGGRAPAYGQQFTAGGFIYPPGPTTATYTFTHGQSCTLTPPVAAAPAPAVVLPSPSAPPPDYSEAVKYPPYEEEPDPKARGRKQSIPGPT